MAITKNIVDMMSGIIQVESEEGIGSTFEVIFEFRIDKEKEKIPVLHSHERTKSIPARATS